MPHKKPADTYISGIAGEHFVLSQLYRKQYDAYLTLGNKKAIDILVVLKSGKTISIDVKTTRGYTSWPVTNVKRKKGHFVVFLAYKGKFGDLEAVPDVYIVPSTKIRSTNTKGGGRVMKNRIEKYENQWNLLKGD